MLLIVCGCIVAGYGDLAFDGYGYALALTCAFMQVGLDLIEPLQIVVDRVEQSLLHFLDTCTRLNYSNLRALSLADQHVDMIMIAVPACCFVAHMQTQTPSWG